MQRTETQGPAKQRGQQKQGQENQKSRTSIVLLIEGALEEPKNETRITRKEIRQGNILRAISYDNN